MIFEIHKPNQKIEKYIESIFYYKDFIPDHSIERVVPTGHIFVIFEFDNFTRHTYDGSTLKPNGNFNKVWISGLHQNYLSISAHKNSEMMVIQFKHLGAYPFIHKQLDQLTEKVLQAEQIFGNDIIELRNSILQVTSVREKFDKVENWLLKRFDANYIPSKEIEEIMSVLKQSSSKGIAELQKNYPKTHKQLISDFKKYVGISPKYFHRILRFNDILLQINQKKHISWSSISYEFGYSDQSHFIKDFKHFSGFNPEEFIKNDFNQGIPNFFPLD